MNNNFFQGTPHSAARPSLFVNIYGRTDEVFVDAQKNSVLPAQQHRRSADGHKAKVLVVGTTSDYIDWLRMANPDRAIFLTDPAHRVQAVEPSPLAPEEILCDLDDADLVLAKLKGHLHHWQFSVDGVACFDCESMELAATIANELSLPYPSVASIRLCRDKYLTKNIWQKNGVPCPRNRLVQSAAGVFDFLIEINGSCVLKPLSGSGSELIFHCSSRKDCEKGSQLILAGLKERKRERLYNNSTSAFLAEEHISGQEYSCDFTIKKDRLDVLRLTKKIKDSRKPFGTIDGYMLCPWSAVDFDRQTLAAVLHNGASALGITEAICMVDFIVCHGEIFLLEMTPRPGGDCLPFLLRNAIGLDVLSYTLDFAQSCQEVVPDSPKGDIVALRLHAGTAGNIVKISPSRLLADPRVCELSLIRKAGHHIIMPPVDYASWYLGHLLFRANPEISIEQQSREIRLLLDVEIEND